MNISLKKIGVLFLFVVSIFIIQFFLVACSQSVEFTIYFDSNGGSEVSSIKTDGKSSITLPNDPIKDGYSFAGWYWDNGTFRDLFTENSLLERGISGNLTVYAKWNEEDTPIGAIKVTFNSMGGSEVNPQYVQKDNTIAIPNTSKVGYTLEGWYTSLNNGQTFDEKWSFTNNKVTTDITLYAKWIINQYTITFNSNGGSSVSSITQDYATTVSKPTDPTKVGYTFAGWYINSSLTTAYTFTTMPAEDITLYAKWNIITYNINYELADGLNHLSNPSSYTIETNTIILSAPTKEGYTFEGWYSDSNFTNYVSEITIGSIGNLTLYAKWQLITYSITYVMNEYTTNDASNPATYNVTSNISLIAPSVIEGTFIGWFTDEDYTNEIENISNMTGNITLYAKVEMNQYTMTFVTNGGTEISPITQDYGTAIHVSTTKEGYMFEAWCSDEGLTTSIDISKMPNANLTVYAKWAQMYEYFTIDNMTYVYYGTYPQTVVDDSSLISSLNSLTSTNANGYYEFEGEEYAKVVADPYNTGYKFINGSTIQSRQTYYFKVEPIKWRVLEEADGTYTLLSEYIIDKQVFYTSGSTRIIGGQTIYTNNYEHSTIREWLNNAFYNKAFSTPEKGSILTTLVDNSASTTESSTNPYFSNNTMDKVYLLSYQEAISSTYGFSTSTNSSSTRTAVTTDYARSVGAYMNTSTSYYGNGYWWLRSPDDYNFNHAHIVNFDGDIYDISYVNFSNYGARPAIKIG